MLLGVVCLLSTFFVFLDYFFFNWVFLFMFFSIFFFYGGFIDGYLYRDFFSLLLVFVTFWVFLFSFLSIGFSSSNFILLWVMMFFLFFSFFTVNYLFFYVFFEFVFIIMFIFLLGWGKTLERLQASFYMFFYTIVFSLPFLIFLVYLNFLFSDSFSSLGFSSYGDFFWIFMVLVFVVKLPLFGFHLWLPKAHVEAPVAGSMILAGVLLKLGGYGLFRFFSSVSFFNFSSRLFFSYFFYVALYGSVFVGLICVRQIDLKMLIAYSSVVHIRVIILGIFSFSVWGVYGGLLMMVAHGFISPMMFYLMTYLYEVHHSRSIMILKGVLLFNPLFCLFWFLCCSLNLRVPPFISFYSEVIIFGSLGHLGFIEWLLVVFSCFFTGVYCIYSYVMVSHGYSLFNLFYFLNYKTVLLSVSHFIFVIFYPFVFFLYWLVSLLKNISLWNWRILLVIFFLFSILFFVLFLFSSFLGVYFINFNGFVFEVIFPFILLREIPFSFCVDYISLFFFAGVSIISRVVFLYSKFYIGETYTDFNFINSRFFYLLFFFVFSMFFLVFSNSWVVVMLGWDGLGLVSFVLVIYYNNSSRLDSGLITVFTNRLGDCLFILSFMFFFYGGIFSIDFLSSSLCMCFCLVFFVGCITKRAQVPFSSWLPAAMAAPTPVSSLVHSSTLVTAGIYLLIRFNYLLSSIFYILIPISLLTIVLAGACAVYELDFKKVVAMSTLSQLGFMIFSISCGYWLLGFLHIVFHAFFKSSLFLSTGNLIHYISGDQDSRDFGSFGFSFSSKLIFSLSCLRLIGFPFSLGFYSKDTIIGDILFSSFSLLSFFFFIGCCFTVAYSLRLIYIGFISFPSFFVSRNYLEDSFFFFTILLLYTPCVFLGNFFFNNFLPPVIFSFLDFFIGLLIIVSGLLVFVNSPSYYILINSLIRIFFLSFVSSSFLSNKLYLMFYKGEYTWGELLGAKGLAFNNFVLASYRLRLYSLKISQLLLIFILFYLLIRGYFFDVFRMLGL